jgi:glycosyltransferase involved in cell wall biosynthesis
MKILAYPRGLGNPYQELLYAPMRANDDEITYMTSLTGSGTLDAALFIPQLIYWRLRGYKIFHLHWAHAFSLYAKIWRMRPFDTFVYWNYLFCLKSIKLLGFKLVWTAHNVLPHEPAFPDDVAARKRLVAYTDLVIAHSQTTLDELKELGIVPIRSVVISHGSYIGVYPDTISRDESRQMLGLDDADFVYLFVGQIRDYKGVDTLIDAYKKIEHLDTRLLIAGECSEQELKSSLRSKLASSKTIRWNDSRVADKDIQLYFRAADVAVLPFKSVTTSGSALLALSFGKAVVVPDIGELRYLPDTITYKYDHGVAEALEKKMIDAQNDLALLQEKSAGAKAYAESLSWTVIAQRTHDAMQELFN